jgi:hypothetical protein
MRSFGDSAPIAAQTINNAAMREIMMDKPTLMQQQQTVRAKTRKRSKMTIY